ncbi:Sugar transporter [Pleurostoma richardsiae]|uniref:Sugar transporter n=1 Tax=Pleurostoma richardsiae TaxID=41990 RepID=A0AA38RNW5_9PEZI|nr:Sugar transporter [Pleurostoma richardsiae]
MLGMPCPLVAKSRERVAARELQDDPPGGFSLENYDVQLAELCEQKETERSLGQCIKEEWPLILCSVGFSTAIIMEGYSMALITGLFAFDTFRNDFGHRNNGHMEIPYICMVSLPLMAQIGQQIGIAVSSTMINRIGFRRTQLVCLLASSALTLIPFFAKSANTLIAAFLLQGIPWGIYQVTGPGYSADVASLKLRPILLASNNLAWALGQLVGSISLFFFQRVQGSYSYKGPFAIQWLFCGVLIIWTLLVPETSYWEIQHGKFRQARRSLKKLLWGSSAERLDEKMAQLAHNVHQERRRRSQVAEAQEAAHGGRRTLRQRMSVFSGVDLRRTEIAVLTWVIQASCGSALAPWCPVFLRRAGLSTDQAFQTNMAMCGLAVIGTLCSWFLMSYAGRRIIYASGLAILSVTLAVLGGLGFHRGLSGWISGGILIFIGLVYQLTVGPFCYSIVAEMPSITLRPQTLAIARFCYNIVGMAQHVLIPKMLMESQWNLGPKTGLPFAATAFLGLLYTLARMPETKGISPRQLDILFENGVSARHFSAERATRLGAEARPAVKEQSPPAAPVVGSSPA